MGKSRELPRISPDGMPSAEESLINYFQALATRDFSAYGDIHTAPKLAYESLLTDISEDDIKASGLSLDEAKKVMFNNYLVVTRAIA